eukprot:TRINITY_DN2253_c0_g1_i3.p3 TRINITY_DN2253_c0_g1~~TRINITY_DN2253_c0_g1_i3.p3  ORF type:complete len:436 (+),score=55.29 TRINITY_DN2253_c0_g1_i3:323-1630(+)
MGIGISMCTSCASSLACMGPAWVGKQAFQRSARIGYCILFTLAMIIAWLMRDFAKPLIEQLPWIVDSDEDHGNKWYGVQAVYRISLGNFLFYIILSIVMIGVRYKNDRREQTIHHGGWLLKGIAWLGLNILPFFFPNGMIEAYGWLARIGSPIFLLIQLLILLDFAMSWNEAWVLKGEEGESQYYTYLLALTAGCYITFAIVIGFLFSWFNPVSGCGLNQAFLVCTICICVVFTLLSLIPRFERTSIFVSGLISVYCVYLCYSALASEPTDYECNGLRNRISAASGTALASGMVLAIVAVVYAAFRAGSNTALFFTGNEDDEEKGLQATPLVEKGENSDGEQFQSQNDQEAEEENDDNDDTPVTYNYSFFHAIFALASMYIAMLMTGWGTGSEQKEMMDVGWASVWVKMATQWVTAAVYVWTIVGPAMFTERDFY